MRLLHAIWLVGLLTSHSREYLSFLGLLFAFFFGVFFFVSVFLVDVFSAGFLGSRSFLDG
jgi:hypothetical protein